MKVSIEDVLFARNFLRNLNNAKLKDIEWYYNSKPYTFKNEEIIKWNFMGLSNEWFIADKEEFKIPEVMPLVATHFEYPYNVESNKCNFTIGLSMFNTSVKIKLRSGVLSMSED